MIQGNTQRFSVLFLAGAGLWLLSPSVHSIENVPGVPQSRPAVENVSLEEPSEELLPSLQPQAPETDIPTTIVRPKWLDKAEKQFAEGVKAHEEGNKALAAKRFRSALKILSRKTEDEQIGNLKDEIEAVFGKLEEDLVPTPEPEPLNSLDVTEEELEEAPVNGSTVAVRRVPYSIPIDPENPLVKKYIALYTGRHRPQMQAALERMGLYKGMIKKEIKEAGLPRELLYLPITESEFKNAVVSPAGAVGLWQFMSGTARKAGLKVNYWVDERRDPAKATRAALRHLKDLHDWFDDWHLALAAYNRGAGGVARDMEFTRSPDFMLLSDRKALPRETEQYVPKFMACVLIADNAASYGFDVKETVPAQIDEVPLEKPIDLRVAAECAGTTEAEIRELNPTLRLWCTPKDKTPFTLRIPGGRKEQFLAKAAAIKNWTPDAGVVKYRVQKGDFLGKIAKRYRTTAQSIQQDNRIKNPKHLRPGQVLVIRPGKKFRAD